MRPVEIANEAIIEAGHGLLDAGRNVTGFALRKHVGGGDATRLKRVWDAYLANKAGKQTDVQAELPVEVAEQLENVVKTLTESLKTLAIEMNDKAVKTSERRVAEVVRAAGETGAQMDRELADAVQTVDDLEVTLEATRVENDALLHRFEEVQATAQAQAVDLAQLRERLAAAEQAAVAAANQHAADIANLTKAESARDEAQRETAKIREEAAQLRGQIEGMRLALHPKAGQ